MLYFLEISCNLNILDCHLLQSESYDFTLRGFDWRFHLEKVSGDDGDVIDVHLERIVKATDNGYSCIATILIELKSFDDEIPSHTDHIQPEEYSATNKMWSIKPFIKWEDLIEPSKIFVVDNQIQLQITVKADERKKPNENPDVILKILSANDAEVTLNLIYHQMKKVLGAISPEFILWGVPMRVQIYQNSVWDEEKLRTLSIFLWNGRKNCDVKIEFDAKITLIAIGLDDNFLTSTNNNNIARNTGTREICKESTWAGFEHFVQWQTLKAMYMTKSGSISMEIVIKKKEPIVKSLIHRSSSPQPSCSTTIKKEPTDHTLLIKCTCCFKNADYCTLCRVSCGHLYCFECVEIDLKRRKTCMMCNEELDLSLPPQIILFN